MITKCPHEFIEREIAVTADGMCPLCMAREIEHLQQMMVLTGASGEFPEGKIDPTDEGEIKIAVTKLADGNIRIDFGKEVIWLALSKQQAYEVGHTLMRAAADKYIDLRIPDVGADS